MANSNITIEVCVDSVESAVAAQDGGAQRVELCDNLMEGGTTPSFGSIEVARKLLNIKLHVIIRPRGGDFLYSETEFEIMKRDVAAAKTLGVNGVVIGILDRDGNIDLDRTRKLTELARPMAVTFHRAFDVCRDPYEALESLVETGIDRVLTSGQHADAMSGAATIRNLVIAARDRIIILACGGIDESTAAAVASDTEAREFHFTAFEEKPSEMNFRNENVAMGSDDASSEYIRKFTHVDKVKRVYRHTSQRKSEKNMTELDPVIV